MLIVFLENDNNNYVISFLHNIRKIHHFLIVNIPGNIYKYIYITTTSFPILYKLKYIDIKKIKF